MKEKNERFIDWLKAFSVVSILMCHFAGQSTNPYFAISGQFFNIGVQIFFIISGFCFGLQGCIGDKKAWYLKRMKRLALPYELFLAVLAIVYIIVGQTFNPIHWLSCIFGLQGAIVGVWGAEQTWFISTLLLCYATTPFVSRLCDDMDDTIRKIVIGICLICPLFIALIPNYSVAVLIPHVFFYALAYMAGRFYRDEWGISGKKAVLAFVVLICALGIRILGRVLLDGTALYNHVIVLYTQYLGACCIFLLFKYLFHNRKPNRIIVWICKLSFEIYLCHYMFVVGPVPLMKVTPIFVLNMLIVILVTLGIGLAIQFLASRISRRFKKCV